MFVSHLCIGFFGFVGHEGNLNRPMKKQKGYWIEFLIFSANY